MISAPDKVRVPRHPGRRTCLVLAAVTVLSASVVLHPALAAPPKLPPWIEEARVADYPNLPARTRALFLHDEGLLEVRPDGRQITTVRGVVRILTRDGRGAAVARMNYDVKSGRIETARAWLIRPSGEVRSYARKEFLDREEFEDVLYSERHVLELNVREEAEPGSVFAWELSSSEQTVFSQTLWSFQSEHPVLRSRYTVRLPTGWRVDGRFFNHAGVDPSTSDAGTTWELGQLAPLPDEPRSPAVHTLAALLAVTIFPPADGSNRVATRAFGNWSQVSEFLTPLTDPKAAVEATISAKAAELTRDATGEWEQIRAIARFAQQIRYVSVQMRIGSGGGVMPHAAAEVLKCGYGDCKDKAALMRALLKARGIESYAVAVSMEDSPVIWEDWPSPIQFNHAIVAVRVGEALHSPAIGEYPEFGRLLFFDPTDRDTQLGDLPADYQGSFALVKAGSRGDLVRLPLLPPEASRLERTISAALTDRGGLKGTVREFSIGQEAVEERRLRENVSVSDYQKVIHRWIAEGVRGAKVSSVQPQDDTNTGSFTLEAAFETASYAQALRTTLMVFKPFILGRRTHLSLTAAERTTPVVLKPQSFLEEITIDLPAGYEVNELPSPVSLEKPFGSYAVTLAAEGERLRLTRKLTVRPATIPTSDYTTVRQFFETILRAEQASVVLQRKAPAS